MREVVNDNWNRAVHVDTEGPLGASVVSVWVEGDGDTAGAPTLAYSADKARELAAALLRAADEAEGYADRPNAVQVGSILTAGALVAFSKSAHTSERLRIASFIRANVNMRGRDFADAEAVADWLEGK